MPAEEVKPAEALPLSTPGQVGSPLAEAAAETVTEKETASPLTAEMLPEQTAPESAAQEAEAPENTVQEAEEAEPAAEPTVLSAEAPAEAARIEDEIASVVESVISNEEKETGAEESEHTGRFGVLRKILGRK